MESHQISRAGGVRDRSIADITQKVEIKVNPSEEPHFCGISLGGGISQMLGAFYGDRLPSPILCDNHLTRLLPKCGMSVSKRSGAAEWRQW